MSRSTRLKWAADYCARALDLQDEGVPYDRAMFATGIAAHGVLEGLQREGRAKDNVVLFDNADRVAESVVTRMVTGGRSFDGVPEPPLPPDAAAAGRNIALSWWNRARETAAVPLAWLPEEPLAVDRDWNPTPYGPNAYFRGILDTVGPVAEEGFDEYSGGTGLCHTDYKTRWDTGPAELETIQLHSQSLLTLANAGNLGMVAPSFIRRRVVNLRTGGDFYDDLWLDDAFDATVATWKKDIALAMAHADAKGPDGRRQAAPGVNCVGCPFVLRCEAAQAHWKGTVIADDAVAIATQYAVIDAAREALMKLVKALVNHNAITVPGGVVGYVAKTQREAAPDIVTKLSRRWFEPADMDRWRAENGRVIALLDAVGIGTAAVDKVGKILFPGKGVGKVADFKALRADLENELLVTVGVAKFGVERGAPVVNDGVSEVSDV